MSELSRVSMVIREANAVVDLLGEGFQFMTPDECDEDAPQRVELYSPGDAEAASAVIPANSRLWARLVEIAKATGHV